MKLSQIFGIHWLKINFWYVSNYSESGGCFSLCVLFVDKISGLALLVQMEVVTGEAGSLGGERREEKRDIWFQR